MKVYRIYDRHDTYIYIDNENKPIEEIIELLRKFFNNYWLGLEELENYDIPNLYEVHSD